MGRRRFAVPAVIAGLVAVGAAVPSIGTASAAPRLPATTPAALVARVMTSHVRAYSGTVTWSADLGLPSIAALRSGYGQDGPAASAFDPTSLLSGTQTFQVWVDGPQHQRIAASRTLGETDIVHDGSQLWRWDSATGTVTHDVFGAGAEGDHRPAGTSPDPAALARELVAQLQRHQTSLAVSPPVRVAGVPAYELRVSPAGAAAATSKVASVTVAVDAANGFPLALTVRAAGQQAPALSVGFTSIHFAAPPAARFAAPTGRRVVTHRIADRPRPGGTVPGTAPTTVGTCWSTVWVGHVTVPASAQRRLDAVTTVVSGTWGTGRLLSTSLVDALLLPDGRLLVGAVRPAVLEAAAAHLGG